MYSLLQFYVLHQPKYLSLVHANLSSFPTLIPHVTWLYSRQKLNSEACFPLDRIFRAELNFCLFANPQLELIEKRQKKFRSAEFEKQPKCHISVSL